MTVILAVLVINSKVMFCIAALKCSHSNNSEDIKTKTKKKNTEKLYCKLKLFNSQMDAP